MFRRELPVHWTLYNEASASGTRRYHRRRDGNRLRELTCQQLPFRCTQNCSDQNWNKGVELTCFYKLAKQERDPENEREQQEKSPQTNFAVTAAHHGQGIRSSQRQDGIR